MRSIQRHHPEIHPSLFDWAERRRAKPAANRMKAYRLDKWLSVHPVYEVSHD